MVHRYLAVWVLLTIVNVIICIASVGPTFVEVNSEAMLDNADPWSKSRPQHKRPISQAFPGRRTQFIAFLFQLPSEPSNDPKT